MIWEAAACCMCLPDDLCLHFAFWCHKHANEQPSIRKPVTFGPRLFIPCHVFPPRSINGAELYWVKLKTVVLSHYIITTAWMIDHLFVWPYYIIRLPLGEWINGHEEVEREGARGRRSARSIPCVPSVLNAGVCASSVPIVLKGRWWSAKRAERGRWRVFQVRSDKSELLWY